MTRLRLNIESRDAVDEAALKALGAAGMIYPTKDTMQVVVGLRADAIAVELRRAAQTGATATAAIEAKSAGGVEQTLAEEELQILLQALGGSGNVKTVKAQGTRLKVQLNDDALLQGGRVMEAGLRGAAKVGDGLVHVLADDSPEPIARALRLKLDAD
jgi:PTS system N-acetylglucosamine-specific IIC component